MYEYRAHVLRVVDGDTVRLAVDLGCDVVINMTVRLCGLNCPEMNTPEGVAAKDFTLAWLTEATTFDRAVVLRTVKDRREKYGRYLGEILSDEGSSLNTALLAGDHAVPLTY